MAREMKDSGVAWIGEIPAEWDVKRMRHILCSNDGGIWGDDPLNDGTDKIVLRSTEQTVDGQWSIINPATRSLIAVDYSKYRISPGDLLITKSSGSGSHIGKTTIADSTFSVGEYYYSNFIQRIRISDSNPTFVWYLLNSPITREQFVYLQNSTSGIGNINADMIQNIYVPIPPIIEQEKIVTFLNRKCAELDVVLEKTRTSIEEYKKLKQAIITQAVTKGVRGDRPMKESGIEWIGAIPENWDVRRIKSIGTYRNGLTYAPEDQADESGTLVLRSSNVQNGKLDFSNNVFVSCEVPTQLMVQKGDILICSRNGSRELIGKSAIIDSDICASFGAFMMIFRCECPRYMYYLLNSNIFSVYLNTFLTTTINQLTGKNFGNMNVVYCPDAVEQDEIVSFLDRRCLELDELISKKISLINSLEFYRKALIYEYVTGKKEVSV